MLFNFNWYDLKAFAQNERQSAKLQQIYNAAIREAARLAASLKLDPTTPFSFNRFPRLKKQVEELFQQMAQQIELTINKGSADAWALANAKNDRFLEFLAEKTGHRKSYLRNKYNYGVRNQEALQAFQTRKVDGMDLSKRVWNYTKQIEKEIEIAIDGALELGGSAESLARRVKQYLNHPDKLFRRVRDKYGNLVPSKAMKVFNPGQGVYRSSHKNAMRLARTEINMAYREADYQRWAQMDFVRGIEIKLSNNPNHCPTCEQLKGIYPKEFKFIGWHPQCRCFAVPALVSEKAFVEGLLNDAPFTGDVVKDLPASFKRWLADNEAKIGRAKNIPYFIRDNRDLIAHWGNNRPEAINIGDILKTKDVKNTEVAELFSKIADVRPEWFRNGLDEFTFRRTNSFFMQHSMAYNSRTGEWVDGSRITVSSSTFGSIGFAPGKELKGALRAIRDGQELTFNQEYALESVWHEILHARTKTQPRKLTKLQSEHMETVNQFVARHTYGELMELLGAKPAHQAAILEKGYGYKSWVANFRKKLADAGISEDDAVKFLLPHLMRDYSNLGEKIEELLKSNRKVEST